MDPSALIREVRKRPLLWDQKNISYHNRTLADQEWNSVAKILGEKKEVAKQKWKSLRDNYRKELKKYKRMEGMYSDEPPLPKWSRFQEMSFLTGIMSTGGNDEPLNAADLVAVSLDKREEEDSSVEMEEEGLEEDRARVEPTISQDTSYFQRREPFTNQRWSTQILSDDNGDLHFLKSLLPFMKMLPPLKKLVVRSEFHNLLIKEITELQNQENQSSEKHLVKAEQEENLTMDENVSSQSKDQ